MEACLLVDRKLVWKLVESIVGKLFGGGARTEVCRLSGAFRKACRDAAREAYWRRAGV